jgi:hypothetical protein
MSQPPSQPYQGEPHPGEPDPNQAYPGQPHQGQPEQPYQGQPEQPHQGQPEQPHQGQPSQPYQGQQYPGQFESGQPAGAGYPPPTYGGQPGYPPPPGAAGQPGYPPPAYPPPAYPPPGGDPGFPGAYPPPAKKKSKALKVVLISLAVVLVVCIGGVVAIAFWAKDEVASVIESTKITVVEPTTLGGRPKLTDPQFATLTNELKAELAKAPGTTGTVGALYGDPANQDIVIVAAASAPLLNPSKQLDDTLNGASAGDVAITDLSTVEPGPLGGTAKCGNGTTSDVKLAVCTWADNGSVGMIMSFFKTKNELQREFVDLRGQIEQKTD